MSLVIYGIVFWIFATITTLFKYNDALQSRFALRVFIKIIPAISAAVFFLWMRPSDTLFYFLYSIALIFCALGDFGMEVDLLPGLGLFLIGHIMYTVNFLWQSLVIGVSLIPIAVFGVVFILMLVYVFLFRRYLQTSEKDTDKALLKAVDVYAIVISLTVCTSVLLWFTTSNPLGYIPVVGAIFFVISDTMIGIREFHHHIKYEEYLVYVTYFLAIFLLSLSVMIYTF